MVVVKEAVAWNLLIDYLNDVDERLVSKFLLTSQNPKEVIWNHTFEVLYTAVYDRVGIVVSIDHVVVAWLVSWRLSMEVDHERGWTSHIGLHSCASDVFPAEEISVSLVVDWDATIIVEAVVGIDAALEKLERCVLVTSNLIPAACVSGHIKFFHLSESRAFTRVEGCLCHGSQKQTGESFEHMKKDY